MSMEEQVVRVGGRRLRLTNLDKVLYPDTGTTKGEVIDYYTRIAGLLLPHINGRPVTRKRWPDGVGTSADPTAPFFAKHLEPGAPGWVTRFPIEHSTGAKDYPLVDEVATLVYLAQVASLELHVPQWRFDADGRRSNPDRMVLDLDPGPGVGLAECAQVARWANEILEGMGLVAMPVTSGSKGIHLYAELPGDQTSDQISALAKELARAIEADHPDLVVSQMAKAMRPGRVFIDWSQNNGAKTTIAPYSLRGRAEPTVAAPRTWAELDEPGLAQVRLDEVLARAKTIGDPMAALGFGAGARSAADGPLATYISMRDATRTPEPVPTNPLAAPAAADQSPRFVIQEHHASRLHYDLRLEHHGVFVSWAVPKGVPQTTQRNHLAVMTEDHPIEYGSFEGEIPAGEYGAGTVTVWDDGHYDLEKWREDEVIFTLDGRAGGPLGRCRLALIRTDGAGEKSTWLLHRMKESPASGSSPPRRSPSDSHTPSIEPMLATATTAGLARAAARRWTDRADGATTAWAELKWDGVRAIGIWDGRRLQLRARSGNDITAKYPELTDGDIGLGPEPAIIDGEIVALDAEGRPSFPRLQARMNLTKPREIAREAPRTPVQYYLFDVLEHDATDAGALPLAERRSILESVTQNAIPAIVVPPVFDDVDDALAAGSHFNLEGIVVKDPRSQYRRGHRSESWLKVKFSQMQEVVIGGIRPGRGGRGAGIGSLLVGVPGDDGLQYAGRVGSGFSEKTLAQLAELLAPLRTDNNPFVGVPAVDAADALWVRPDLVGEVEFAEFTPGGILRQARWRGLRPDKHPADVVREAAD